MKRVTSVAHAFMLEHLSSDANVVDLTVGNGNDTLVCLQHFSHVIGFDVQLEAILNALKKCEGYPHLHLIHTSHEHLDLYIHEPMDAYIFNSGYLPHSSSSLCTHKESTLIAIKKALSHLKESGFLILTFYRKQAFGQEEYDEVHTWLKSQVVLDECLSYQYDDDPLSPILKIFQKRNECG